MFGKFAGLLAFAVAFGADQSALAQKPANDAARCEQLYALYERHSQTGGEALANGNLEARAARALCREGDVEGGIAILQRKLRALGFKV